LGGAKPTQPRGFLKARPFPTASPPNLARFCPSPAPPPPACRIADRSGCRVGLGGGARLESPHQQAKAGAVGLALQGGLGEAEDAVGQLGGRLQRGAAVLRRKSAVLSFSTTVRPPKPYCLARYETRSAWRHSTLSRSASRDRSLLKVVPMRWSSFPPDRRGGSPAHWPCGAATVRWRRNGSPAAWDRHPATADGGEASAAPAAPASPCPRRASAPIFLSRRKDLAFPPGRSRQNRAACPIRMPA